jgi:hypothetical protein
MVTGSRSVTTDSLLCFLAPMGTFTSYWIVYAPTGTGQLIAIGAAVTLFAACISTYSGGTTASKCLAIFSGLTSLIVILIGGGPQLHTVTQSTRVCSFLAIAFMILTRLPQRRPGTSTWWSVGGFAFLSALTALPEELTAIQYVPRLGKSVVAEVARTTPKRKELWEVAPIGGEGLCPVYRG